MDEPLGKGSLTELERLKAEYGEAFKAAAPKRRKRGPLCLRFRCPKAELMEFPGGLRLKGGSCKLARCPRKPLEEYLRLLGQTRYWRKGRDRQAAAFWWATVKRKRDQLRKALGCGV